MFTRCPGKEGAWKSTRCCNFKHCRPLHLSVALAVASAPLLPLDATRVRFHRPTLICQLLSNETSLICSGKIAYMRTMGRATYLLIYLTVCCYPIQSAFTLALNPFDASNFESDYVCRAIDTWTRPSWPSNVQQHCRQLLQELIVIEPEIRYEQGPRHEFLAPNQDPDPETGAPPVHTPWKLTSGPCTLAITTIHSIPVGWLPPELGPGPFPPFGYATWGDIWHLANWIWHYCVQNRVAGIRWTQSQDTLTPALGVFFYATGSEIDRVIGPKVNGLFTLPHGVNVTGSKETLV